jgi:phage-related minor tail protein
MRKLLNAIGAIFLIFLMLSNATAVSQIHSEPVMKNINENIQQVTLLEEKLDFYIEKLSCIAPNILPEGILDFILAIIRAIINKIIDLINSLTEFIQDVMQLVSALIDAIKALINVIIQFIELITGLFTSENTTFIQ